MIFRTRIFLLLLLTTLALGGCAGPPYTNIDNARLKVLLAQGVPIYDIRRPEEWRETGVVADIHNHTFVEAGGRFQPHFIPRFTQEVRPDQPVILICRSGNRTDSLARELVEKMGYTQVYNVRNGITSWIGEGNPVVKN